MPKSTAADIPHARASPLRLLFKLGLGLSGLLVAPVLLPAFSEAPTLAQQVAAGKIPPLEKRLPLAPLLIMPLEKPGTFGGNWRMVLVGYDNASLLFRTLDYEHLVRWNPAWTRVLPNVASSWTVNADTTVYRFQLRRGMRWSDGEPYTAHDIVAWVDDVARDPELAEVPPGWLVIDGQLPACFAPDDFTVEFRFAKPNALFLEQLAGMRSNDLTHYPAHYYRQWHPKYNPTGAAQLMQRTGLPWAAAFRTLYTPWNWRNIGAPTIDPWIVTNAYVPGVTEVLAVRNPYYWKVDTLGRQLPYLDQVQFNVVPDNTEALRRVLAGEVDYQRNDFAAINVAAGPALRAAEKAGIIQTIQVIPSRANPIAICLNLVHRDPVLRTVLADKRVRTALSEAINRPALIEQLYSGKSKPWQVAPRPASPHYHRRLAEQYTEFAPERSKQSLAATGLLTGTADKKLRLPDGRLFQIDILVPAPGSPTWSAILDQLKHDWAVIGVTLEWTLLPQKEFYERIQRNEHDGAILKGDGGYGVILEPQFVVPVSFEAGDQAFYAVPWARWFINPQAEGAEKPPASVEKQMALFRQVLAEPNADKRTALMAEVLEMAADEFYVMGICLEPERFAIRTPEFRNVPRSHFDSWLYPDPGPLNPCQFFKETTVEPGR